uniref:Prolactin-induced protein n=1 Tax=Canis lupus familiaris TaxID=9615 RepID=A0A8I3PBW1_CANLF
MHLLQLLFRAGPAILLLAFCLQFRTNKAEEDTRKVLSMEVQMPRKAAPNEEISVTVRVQTELRECMVIQCSLLSRNPMEGPFNYVYTACLCDSNPRTFYWDFRVNKTMSIIALTHIIDKEDICPFKAVVPNGPKYFYMVKNIKVS